MSLKYVDRGPLGAISLALLLGLAFAPSARAQDCPPIVVLGGPGPLVAELTTDLVARGLRVEPAGLPPGECGSLSVELQAVASGTKLKISDPWGRSAERVVQDLLTSSSLIESWARMDLLDGAATSTRAVAQPIAAPAPKPALRAPVLPEPEAAAPTAELSTEAIASAEPSLSLRISAEGGLSRGEARWLGVSAGACAQLGVFCLGLEGRYALSNQRQNDLEALGTLALPLHFGVLSLTPELGFGGGWLSRADLGDDDRRGRLERGPPNNDGLGLRAEATLRAGLALSDSLRLQLGAGASVSPDLERGRSFLGDPQQVILRGQAGLVWELP